jgi:uncharacterized membrane protein
MKKYFLAGLTVLLPFALTMLLTLFALGFLTAPFQESAYHFLSRFDNLKQPFLFFSADQVLSFASTLLSLAFLVVLVLGIGFLGHFFYARSFFLVGDRLLHRIPLFRTVYRATQEGVNSFLQSKDKLFTQVVLAPFPEKQALALGMVQKLEVSEGNQPQQVLVFIPGAPNATFALMLLYKPEELTPLDLPVEEAFKMIVSCGTAFSAGLTLAKSTP